MFYITFDNHEYKGSLVASNFDLDMDISSGTFVRIDGFSKRQST